MAKQGAPRKQEVITVQYQDKSTTTGIVAGYANQFATIITDRGMFEAAWQTVEHCLATGKPIRY